jgi:HSP20 family protein
VDPAPSKSKTSVEELESWQLLVGIRSGKLCVAEPRELAVPRDERRRQPLTTASFVPAVDIYEDTKKVVLKLEVPGIEEKDLDVRVENNTLTVKGERKFEKEEKEENFHRIERRYGSFYRAFTLPSTVDTEHIGASYNAGVLKLELARRPRRSPSRSRSTWAARRKWKSRSLWERGK